MVIVAVLLVVLTVLWVRRRRRKVMLAGLTSARPTFMIEPPHRRMSGLDREAL